jgi:HK97 family phage major capsid protein
MKNLKELQERYGVLLDEIKGLSDKESLTDDETKSLSEKMTEAKGLKTDIEKGLEMATDLKDLNDFRSKPNFTIDLGTKNQTEPPVQGETTWEGKAGTETVFRDDQGHLRSLDADGWALSQKQFRAISEPSYKKAWINVVFRGMGDSADYKQMQEGLDSAGGYLVPPDIALRIIARRPHPTEILNNVSRLTTSRDKLTLPKHKYSTDDKYATGVRIAWTGETGTASEDTSLQNWGQTTFDIHTGTFEIQMGKDFLEDTAFPIESWMVQQAQSSYALGMDNIVVNGNGVAKPRGILYNVGAADEPPSVNIGNPVTADNILAFIYGMPPQYATNAKVLMNRTNVYATFAQIKDTANNYIFGLRQNIDGGLATARGDTLLGYPMIYSAFMPDGTAAAKVMAFGDFQEGYAFLERVGFSVIETTDRDMHNANKRSWLFRFRVGGGTLQDRALRVGVQS